MRVLSQTAETVLRVLDAKPKPRSALVVSHHLNGLLRTMNPGVLQPVPTMGFIAFPEAVDLN